MSSYKNIVVFLCIIISHASDAFIVKLSDMHTMAKRSDMVIHGYVGEQLVTKDEYGRLITLTDIEVVDGLYGAKTGDVVTVYQVGGQKNGEVMPLLGGQQYAVGQELIFFGLKMDNAYVSYGAGQGKFDIINDQGKDLVMEDLGNVLSLDPKSNHESRPHPLTFSGTSILKNEIKQMILSK